MRTSSYFKICQKEKVGKDGWIGICRVKDLLSKYVNYCRRLAKITFEDSKTITYLHR